MDYIISKELLQLLGDYLSSRPYREVYVIINNLQALSPVGEETVESNDD